MINNEYYWCNEYDIIEKYILKLLKENNYRITQATLHFNCKTTKDVPIEIELERDYRKVVEIMIIKGIIFKAYKLNGDFIWYKLNKDIIRDYKLDDILN